MKSEDSPQSPWTPPEEVSSSNDSTREECRKSQSCTKIGSEFLADGFEFYTRKSSELVLDNKRTEEVIKQSGDPKQLHEPTSKKTIAPMIKTMNKYEKIHILVTAHVRPDGFCLFYSVIEAQKRYHWGNKDLTLDELKRRVKKGAQQNKKKFIQFLDEKDQPKYDAFLEKYLRDGAFDSSVGDFMPILLARYLKIKIYVNIMGSWNIIEPRDGVFPRGAIFLRLENFHYTPYINVSALAFNNETVKKLMAI